MTSFLLKVLTNKYLKFVLIEIVKLLKKRGVLDKYYKEIKDYLGDSE